MEAQEVSFRQTKIHQLGVEWCDEACEMEASKISGILTLIHHRNRKTKQEGSKRNLQDAIVWHSTGHFLHPSPLGFSRI